MYAAQHHASPTPSAVSTIPSGSPTPSSTTKQQQQQQQQFSSFSSSSSSSNPPASNSHQPFQQQSSSSSSSPNHTAHAAHHLDVPTPSNIEVFVRIRPLLPSESSAPDRSATSIVDAHADNKSVSINHPSKQLQCTYDKVFPPHATQEHIFDSVSSCAAALVDGFNCTIFAYGQTGSGKTHTMFGPAGDSFAVQRSSYGGPNHAVLSRDAGVIPRSIVSIFKSLGQKNLGIVNLTVYVSFVQVYNEQLYDMLRDPRRSASLEIHEESGSGTIYVSGLSEYAVRNAGDCLALVKLGEENRAIRETHMNTASSRSHSLFQLVVEQTRVVEDGLDGERVLKSKFNLVDLAGSEKWDTKQGRKVTDEHVSEMTNINLSLYTLGRCIAALAKNGKNQSADPSAPTKHVPFRESKLTRLLQDSLGGNSKTMLIATLSPASDCLDETISTLRFADRAHQVMTFVRLNEKRPVDHKLVQRLQSEVARLRALLGERGLDGATMTATQQFASSMFSAANNNSSSNNNNFPALAEQLQAAKNQIAALVSENNTLRKRLGMPELLNSDAPVRVGTPQGHTPSRFPIVGGGNSEAAVRIRNATAGASREDTEELRQQLSEIRSSHERLASTMSDLEKVTSSFFRFDIEEEELKDSVQKLMKIFKKERKSYGDVYDRIDNYVPTGGSGGGGGGFVDKSSPPRAVKKSGPSPSNNAATFNGPPTGVSAFDVGGGGGGGGGSPSGYGFAVSSSNGSLRKGMPVGVGGGGASSASGSTTTAASAVGVAYRIRGKVAAANGAADTAGGGGGAGGGRPASPIMGKKGSAETTTTGGGGGVGIFKSQSSSDWIREDSDSEGKLRKELKVAKAKMKKQMEMQDWLEKKEDKALAAFEAEEEARKKFDEEKKEKDKKFRDQAKKQKRKLEKYYNRLRAEVEGGDMGGGGGGANDDDDDDDDRDD